MKRSRLDLKFKSAHIRYRDQVFEIEVTPDIADLTSELNPLQILKFLDIIFSRVKGTVTEK